MKKQLLLIAGSLMIASGSLSAQTIVLSENFEGGSLPAGWTVNPTIDAWAVPCVTSQNFTPPAHTVYAGINDDAVQAASNPASKIITPTINLSANPLVFLSYDAFFMGATWNSVTEECDLRYSVDGGTTWNTVGPLGTSMNWETYTLDLSAQIGGQSNVKLCWEYNDGGDWLYGACIDNVTLYSPPAISAALSAITPEAGTGTAYGVVNTNINLGGEIQNLGATAITSIVVKYDAGAGVQTYNLSSINIAPLGSYTFTHNVPFMIPSLGNHPVTMWIELTGDAGSTDNTLNTTVVGASFSPVHVVTVEEATGTWCGWCVRGAVYLDSIWAQYASTVNLVAVHNGDPMVVTAYDAGVSAMVPGYPATLVNRSVVSDPSAIFDDRLAYLGDFGFANITPTVVYNDQTRACQVTASLNFAVDLTGDYRLLCVYTEDHVTGTASGYAQVNYYSGGTYGPMGGFENLPDPVPASQMEYNFVARNMQGAFNGQAGSLPATITAGSTQTYTFPSYTIPTGFDVLDMRVIVMLIDNNGATPHIMNSARAPIYGGAVGTQEVASANGVSVFPNPFNESATIALNLASDERVVIEVYSTAGQLISSQNHGELAAGQHNIALDGTSLAQGMYLVKVIAGDKVTTTRVSVMH